MTIFLTTQYLEEADELADRVGIIDGGQLVAEGTPDELKRSVGNDVIVARVDGDAGRRLPPWSSPSPASHGVEARGNELVVTAADGAAAIGPVAVALDNCGIAGARPHAAHADARRRVPRADRHASIRRGPTDDRTIDDSEPSREERPQVETRASTDGPLERTTATMTRSTPPSRRRPRRAPSAPARPASRTTSHRSPGGRCGRCPATSRR